ncbi:MAG: GIY-YIG nuclease family protein [Patescibacteria group bacterium]
MYYVYVLFCADQNLYIGYSENLKQRIETHQAGGAKSTKHRRPVELIYYECYRNKKDAKAREIYLKSGAGHKQMKKQHQHEFHKIDYKHKH